MKNFKYIFILNCLWLTACTQDNDPLPQEVETATVHLNLLNASIDVDTRSTTPQDPRTDNPMYSLWLLHYNSEGQLIDKKYQDLGDPHLTYTWSPTLQIKGGNETLCLVANMNEDEAPANWPERLANFKETYATLKFNKNTGLVEQHKMYMFGYYEGELSSGRSINIMMGRMAAALKFVITPKNTFDRYKITNIELKKVSKGTYYFPGNLPTNDFTTITEAFDNNNEVGNSTNSELIYYYQVGENINPVENNCTTVVITAIKGIRSDYGRWTYSNSTPKTYTVPLGSDAPTPPTANRNCSLYRNNNYTFNIHLKD